MKEYKFVKKISILFLAILMIFSGTYNAYAQNEQGDVFKTFCTNNELKIVDEVPKGVTPLKVENLDELEKIVNSFKKELSSQSLQTEIKSKIIQPEQANLDSIKPLTIHEYPITYHIHKATVINLNNVGAKLISEVAYWVVGSFPPVFTKDYHDVYKSGISYNCRVTYNEKSAVVSSDRSHISVRVRGTLEVYVEIPGGELIVLTDRFDKKYTIGYVG